MKVQPLMVRIINKIEDCHSTRIDRLAKQHVQIHEVPWAQNDALDQIRKVQITLGNYARKENVRIDIYNGGNILNEYGNAKDGIALKNKFFITVKNLHNSIEKHALLPNNSLKTYQYKEIKHRLYQTSDETEISIPFVNVCHEDTFIRTLYRTIGKMVNDLKTTK